MDKEAFLIKLKIYGGVVGFGVFLSLFALLLRPDDRVMGIIQGRSYQYDESERRLLKSHEENPRDTTVLLELSNLYRILGEPGKEAQYLNLYLELKPLDTKVRMELAQVYLWSLKPEAATKEYERILNYEPNNVTVLRKLTQNYNWEQKYDKAIACFEKLSEFDKMEFNDYKALINIYIGTQDLYKAIPIYERIWTRMPKHIALKDYQDLADLYLWTNQSPKAKKLLEQLLVDTDSSMEARSTYLDWFTSKQMFKPAIKAIHTWIEKYPQESFELRNQLVGIYLKEGQKDKAAKILEDIIKSKKSTMQHVVKLFWLYADSEDYEDAVRIGERIPDATRTKEGVWESLAHAYEKVENFQEAIRLRKIISKASPDDIDAHDSLLWLYHSQKMTKETLKELKWLLKRFPERQKYIEAYVGILLDQKKYKEALVWAKKGLELNSTSEFFVETTATCALAVENFEEAIIPLKTLFAMFPNNRNHGFLLVDALMKTKRHKEAVPHLETMWKRYGKNTAVGFKITQYLGWCYEYKSELKYLENLEARQEGDQYLDHMIAAATYDKNYPVLETLLVKKIKTSKSKSKLLETLRELYVNTNQYEKELELLNDPANEKHFSTELRLGRTAKLYEDLGNNTKALAALEEYYPHAKEREKIRKKLLKIALWVDNIPLKIRLYEKYADRNSPEMLELIELYVDQKDYTKAEAYISTLPKQMLQTEKALKLQLTLAYESGDRKKVGEVLSYLIEKTTDKELLVGFLLDFAAYLQGERELDQAKEHALKALELAPASERANVMLGQISFSKENYNECVEYFKRTKRENLYDRFMFGAAHVRLGQAFERKGRAIFNRIKKDIRPADTAERWNLELDMGYELDDKPNIVKAWRHIEKKYLTPKEYDRFALHLYGYGEIEPAYEYWLKSVNYKSPAYLTLQRIFEPASYNKPFEPKDKLLISRHARGKKNWFHAMLLYRRSDNPFRNFGWN